MSWKHDRRQNLEGNLGVHVSEWAEEELTTLVRRVLPPKHPEWLVQVVDRPEEAMFDRNLVRVQRNWRAAVYEQGLHFVMMHYPLSLRPAPSNVLRRTGSRSLVDIWEVRAIKKWVYTGTLAEARGYVARALRGNGLAFHRDAAEAEFAALREARRPNRIARRLARARKHRIAEFQTLLRERAICRKYDGYFRVPIASYERLLPGYLVETYRNYEGGVPLSVIENAVVDLVPFLDERTLHNLVFQLERDLDEALEEAEDRAMELLK
jgi:hypothetical protein